MNRRHPNEVPDITGTETINVGFGNLFKSRRPMKRLRRIKFAIKSIFKNTHLISWDYIAQARNLDGSIHLTKEFVDETTRLLAEDRY